MSKTKEEFKSVIEQRLYETSKFWSDCNVNYDDIKEFVSSLNATIQSLRNITFILQSYKSVIPDFDTWYEDKQTEMKNDSYLRWAHLSRNTVVKESNLKLKSETTVGLLNWEDHPVEIIEVDPLTKSATIKKSVLSDKKLSEIVKELREPIVRISRCWIADNMPQEEILFVLAFCYRYFKDLISEAYLKIGLTANDLAKIEKDSEILDEHTYFENARTIYLDLKDGKILHQDSTLINTDDKDLRKKVKKRYGDKQPKHKKKGDKLLNWFEAVTEKSKQVLTTDGHHVPMVFLMKDGVDANIRTFVIEDRKDLYYHFRKLGDDILKGNYNGVVTVSEMWKKDEKLNIRGEVLIVAVASREHFEVRMIPFERVKNDQVKIKDMVSSKDRSSFPILKYAIEAIEKVG